MGPLARGKFQNSKALIQDALQAGGADRLSSFEPLQGAEKRAPDAAGPMCPVRIYRDSFEAGQQQLKDLNLFAGLHGFQTGGACGKTE